MQEDDIIAQQAALAQAKFGGLKKKSPMLNSDVRLPFHVISFNRKRNLIQLITSQSMRD